VCGGKGEPVPRFAVPELTARVGLGLTHPSFTHAQLFRRR